MVFFLLTLAIDFLPNLLTLPLNVSAVVSNLISLTCISLDLFDVRVRVILISCQWQAVDHNSCPSPPPSLHPSLLSLAFMCWVAGHLWSAACPPPSRVDKNMGNEKGKACCLRTHVKYILCNGVSVRVCLEERFHFFVMGKQNFRVWPAACSITLCGVVCRKN